MGRPDSLLRYVTRPLLVTFVACHPFPLCRLCCHSPLSLSSRAEMSLKIIWKNNWELTMTSQWSASETQHTMLWVELFVFLLWCWSIHLWQRLEVAVMCSVALYIVQISRADIWFPVRCSHVHLWHINWVECICVSKWLWASAQRVSQSTESVWIMCLRPCSQTAGSELHWTELTHYSNDQPTEYILITTSVCILKLTVDGGLFTCNICQLLSCTNQFFYINSESNQVCDIKDVALVANPHRTSTPICNKFTVSYHFSTM